MLDVFEYMESAAERKWDDMYVDADHYRCDCGAVVPNGEMNFLSQNPYCAPCCNKCFDEAF
jgi:hypothetical protein